MSDGLMDWAGLIVSLLVGSGGATWYFTERRRGRLERERLAADARRSSAEQRVADLGVNLELSEYIDARVEKQVKPIRDELAQVRTTERVRTLAITRILRSIANQWPLDVPGPILDPDDIAAVEDAIPQSWLDGNRRPHR